MSCTRPTFIFCFLCQKSAKQTWFIFNQSCLVLQFARTLNNYPTSVLCMSMETGIKIYGSKMCRSPSSPEGGRRRNTLLVLGPRPVQHHGQRSWCAAAFSHRSCGELGADTALNELVRKAVCWAKQHSQIYHDLS